MPYVPTSLHRHIRSHSVFVFCNGGKNNGSGVLIEIANRIFVLSAEHVIKDDVDINLGILPHQSKFEIIDKWSDQETDIGFLELNRSEVQLRLSEYSEAFPVRLIKPQAIQSWKTTLALCGFPWSEGSETHRGREIPVVYITVPMIPVEKWPGVLRDRFDPKKAFVVAYGPKWGGSFTDGNKNPIDPISPHGLSGCGLWYFDLTTEHFEKPVYALCGVQHTYFPDYQVLVGALIDPLVIQIAEHCGINLSITMNE